MFDLKLLLNADESLRLKQMVKYEEALYVQGYQYVAGIDEAGRGPLAGPVVAAVCFIPPGILINGINDSKQLTEKRRKYLFEYLTTDSNILYGVGMAEAPEIDRLNIFQATMQAMWRAVEKLSCHPDYLLIDGKYMHHPHIPSCNIVHGDQLSQSIAAASIIAKEIRDKLMVEYHQQWPIYRFDLHKGYGTKLHLQALRQHGACVIHRQSFAPVKTSGQLLNNML